MNEIVVRKPANHPLHLILTVFTCGMWAPVWVVCAMVGRKETVKELSRPVHFNERTGRWEYV